MPGAVPVTSTAALTNATLPYILELVDHGVAGAFERDAGFAERPQRRPRQRDQRAGRARPGARVHAACRGAGRASGGPRLARPEQRTWPCPPRYTLLEAPLGWVVFDQYRRVSVNPTVMAHAQATNLRDRLNTAQRSDWSAVKRAG